MTSIIINAKEVVSNKAEVIGNKLAAAKATIAGEPEDPVVAAAKLEAKKNHEAIIQGLLQGRLEWAGHVSTDFWFYLKQNDVVLGILLCHRMNPYGRLKRFFVWVAYLIATFGMSLLFLRADGQRIGGRDGFDHAASKVASIWSSLTISVVQIIVVEVLTCRCCQPGAAFAFLLCRKVGEGVGWCVYLYCLFLGSCVLAGGIVVAVYRGVPASVAVDTWLYTQLYSFSIGIATAFAMFILGYYGFPFGYFTCLFVAEAGPTGTKSSSCYPHGPQYPTDKGLLWSGDPCGCCCLRPTEPDRIDAEPPQEQDNV